MNEQNTWYGLVPLLGTDRPLNKIEINRLINRYQDDPVTVAALRRYSEKCESGHSPSDGKNGKDRRK